jgi:hypothetical protein
MQPDEAQNGLSDAALLMPSYSTHTETCCGFTRVPYQPTSRARQNRLRNSRITNIAVTMINTKVRSSP